MARNITIHVEGDSLTRGKGTKIFEAIGFLCSYGMSGYTTVDIYPDGERDLIACYKTADEKGRFTMGATWRESEGKYSFHSRLKTDRRAVLTRHGPFIE